MSREEYIEIIIRGNKKELLYNYALEKGLVNCSFFNFMICFTPYFTHVDLLYNGNSVLAVQEEYNKVKEYYNNKFTIIEMRISVKKETIQNLNYIL